jgi:hypothetical protein
VGFRPEPIHPADTDFPTAAHARAPLLVRPGDTALCAGALAERVPLLWCDGGHERCVHGIEHVEVRQCQRRLGPALRLLAMRRAYRADDNDPW